MKKMILLEKEGKLQRVLMSFEEVCEQFSGTAYSLSKQYYETMKRYGDCDLSDLRQEADIALWKAYNTFDDTKNYKFITLAINIMKQRFNYIIRSKKQQKRDGENKIFISLDDSVQDKDGHAEENYNFLITENFESDVLNGYIMEQIKSNLTDKEKLYLLVLIDEIKAVNLANHLGISRAAVSKNLAKIKNKLRYMINEFELMEE